MEMEMEMDIQDCIVEDAKEGSWYCDCGLLLSLGALFSLLCLTCREWQIMAENRETKDISVNLLSQKIWCAFQRLPRGSWTFLRPRGSHRSGPRIYNHVTKQQNLSGTAGTSWECERIVLRLATHECSLPHLGLPVWILRIGRVKSGRKGGTEVDIKLHSPGYAEICALSFKP